MILSPEVFENDFKIQSRIISFRRLNFNILSPEFILHNPREQNFVRLCDVRRFCHLVNLK